MLNEFLTVEHDGFDVVSTSFSLSPWMTARTQTESRIGARNQTRRKRIARDTRGKGEEDGCRACLLVMSATPSALTSMVTQIDPAMGWLRPEALGIDGRERGEGLAAARTTTNPSTTRKSRRAALEGRACGGR